jgi:hypothetical protein
MKKLRDESSGYESFPLPGRSLQPEGKKQVNVVNNVLPFSFFNRNGALAPSLKKGNTLAL